MIFYHQKFTQHLRDMGLVLRQVVRRPIVNRAAILLVVLLFVLLPVRAPGQTQLQGTPQDQNKCVSLKVRAMPMSWVWDDEKDLDAKQSSKTYFLHGDTLGVRLVQTETQPASSSAKQNIPPEAEKPVFKTVEVCATWNVTDRVSESSKSLPLVVRIDNEKEAHLQVHLDADFPPSVRRSIRVMLTSSLSTIIPIETKEIKLSSWWLCILIASGFLATIYFFLAKSVHTFYSHSGRSPNRLRTHGWRILDPIVISAGDYGAANLANLQILWFSLIVAWILAYAWLTMGRLLNPSLDLLGLLGISGGVNVLHQSLTSAQQRLSLDSWNWLVERNFLRKETDIDPVDVAKWRDLVIDRGVLDPSRYQLIIFGFLVGINLLFSNVIALEKFQTPQFFLLLQGLSSSLYLFGKSISPNTKDELEARIVKLSSQDDSLLTSEDKYYLKRTISSLYGPMAVGDELKPPKLPDTILG